ncbi:cation:proton antiporter [Actinoplanes sp. NPDC051861]|uniref:cation:proton antiporter domain-containing protein n=1 Tax=Actinoplanes sp. NPDC051861 TaxID=3155170 RepID=UPI00344530E6
MPVTVQMLLSVSIVIIAVRAVGQLLIRIGQPRVIGEIIAGILLGPGVLGVIWPEALETLFPDAIIGAFRSLAQIGLILFIFLIGVELNVAGLRRVGRRAGVISGVSVVVPFLLGAGLGALLYQRFGQGVGLLGFSLFLGAAIAITAFPVLARLLQETGLFHTRAGVLAITCAAIDDVVAWCLLATVVAVMTSASPAGVVVLVVLAATYVVFMVAAVRPVLARLAPLPLWLALVVTFVSAWITEAIGIHALFGAFLAGAVMPRDERWRRAVQERLQAPVEILLLPLFFVIVGLSTRVDGLGSWALIGVFLLVTAVAVVGKLGGATVAARISGEPWSRSVAIGVLMNTRGLTEIVILTAGLELGVIGTEMFTIMVLMAIATTVMAPPLLRRLGRYDAVSAADTALAESAGPKLTAKKHG